MRVSKSSTEKQSVQTTLQGEKLQADWNFAKADTTYLTHGLHDYPARMIPQIAQRLIANYTNEGDIILDPFCGSGTTLVEARLANRSAIGGDINPFAVLLAKAKATPIDFNKTGFKILDFLSKLEKDYFKTKNSGKLPKPPVRIYPSLLHWFKEDAARDLEFLYKKITRVRNADIRDLLKIILSDTIFKCSNINHRSSRFIRILPENKLKQFKPNVIAYFHREAIDSVNRVAAYASKLKEISKDSHGEPIKIEATIGDARELRFGDESFDAIVTSPPYGEEKNTVGYARWSKFSIAWLRLNHDTLKEVERRSLGFAQIKDVVKKVEDLPSPTAKALLSDLAKTDAERVKDALSFFFEYLDTLKEMFRVLRHGAFCCVVIGDRSIRRRALDMEKVTTELGKVAGFIHEDSFFREIPMKLIPWTTPTGRTISRESMVILKKR